MSVTLSEFEVLDKLYQEQIGHFASNTIWCRHRRKELAQTINDLALGINTLEEAIRGALSIASISTDEVSDYAINDSSIQELFDAICSGLGELDEDISDAQTLPVISGND